MKFIVALILLTISSLSFATDTNCCFDQTQSITRERIIREIR